ncbi:MAG: hypothetical protein ABWZ08_02160 [Pseudoxanthomonas sp.]
MSDDAQQEPCKKDPAPQPADPSSNCTNPPPAREPPKITPEPEPCTSCCDCPTPPGTSPTCLDDLIAIEARSVAQADRAKAFKADLEALQQKAKAAQLEYTADKYKELLERWKKQDADIVALLKKLTCAVPCWWCVVECVICPMLYSVRDMERNLNGTGERYATANSLYDRRYWWQRERDDRNRVFERIKKVLGAWEAPAKTIDKALTDNAKLIADMGALLGPDIPKALYDALFRLVPMHLAIAPPASTATTAIEQRFVGLCGCDDGGARDDCCGPNVGVPSLRERLIDPQPYLILPEKYADLICCLAKTRYHPAKEALAQADSELALADAEIARVSAEIGVRLASLPADAKAALSGGIDCDKYRPKPKGEGKPDADGNGGSGCCGGDRQQDRPPGDPSSSN